MKAFKKLGYGTYHEYLKSSHWRNFKKRYFASHPRLCAVCGSSEKIELHHVSYERLGNEREDSDVKPLCRPCHEVTHLLVDTGVPLRTAHARLKNLDFDPMRPKPRVKINPKPIQKKVNLPPQCPRGFHEAECTSEPKVGDVVRLFQGDKICVVRMTSVRIVTSAKHESRQYRFRVDDDFAWLPCDAIKSIVVKIN